MAKLSGNYEVVFILNPNLDEEATAAMVAKFKTLVEQNGTPAEVEEWGKRHLAYPINDLTEGYYVLMTFSAKPEFPRELDRILRITAGHAARMERTHGQLCSRLTDGLCRNDSDRFTYLYGLACCHVGAVTLGAHTDMGLTAEDGTNLHRLASCLIQHLHNSCGALRCTHMVSLNHNLSRIRVSDGLSDIASCDSLFQVLDDFISIHKGLDFHK